MRIVRQHRGVPDEEGFLLLAATAHEVVDRLHRLPADREAIIAMPAPLRHALGEAAMRKMSLPPLAGLEAGIAHRGQELRQERPLGEVTVHRRAAFGKQFLALWRGAAHAWLLRRVVAHDPVLVRVAASDDRGEARAAEARGHVAMGEHQALTGEAVERRRPQVGVAQEGIVPPVLIIGNDEDDVSRRRVCHRWCGRSRWRVAQQAAHGDRYANEAPRERFLHGGS